MHVAVVYESMFGNTRKIADAIAEGASRHQLTTVVSVAQADEHVIGEADLLIVGGPTHAWSLSRPTTRSTAADQAADPANGVALEPDATGDGLREWLVRTPELPARAAVFSTKAETRFSGSAAGAIRRLLRGRRVKIVSPPESFVVTKRNVLVAGEIERARAWGESLAMHAEPLSQRGHTDEML